MIMIGTRLNATVESITRIREQVPIEEILTKLTRPKTLDWLPSHIDSRSILSQVRANVPLAFDVVEWMQLATADLAVLQTAAESYAKAGSAIAVASGDGYSPSVSTSGIYAVSQPGGTVRSQGYGIIRIGGLNFQCPILGKITMIGQNFLAWASLPDPGSGIQWLINLMNWLELARSPINTTIPFPSTQGHVAPQFFMVSTTIPTPIHRLNLTFQSDKPQTITIASRYSGDYTTKLFELPVNLNEGETAVSVFVRGFPLIPPYVLHLQPEDDTQTTVVAVSTRPQ